MYGTIFFFCLSQYVYTDFFFFDLSYTASYQHLLYSFFLPFAVLYLIISLSQLESSYLQIYSKFPLSKCIFFALILLFFERKKNRNKEIEDTKLNILQTIFSLSKTLYKRTVNHLL